MQVHHLNCGTVSPGGARFVCHVLLIELKRGLALVDTGLGLGDIARPERLGETFLQNARPKLDREETAIHQIRALGHDPHEVRHIVMTHLDRDHAGGLNDFPQAQVHLHDAEYRCALEGAPGVRPGRYVAEQWSPETQWQRFGPFSSAWYGLPAAAPVPGEPDILAVALPGHTPGHCGVAIRTPSGWLLHSGDSHYHHWQRRLPPQSPSPGLAAFQESADSDRPTREASQLTVCELAARHPEVDVVCTHDPHDLDRHRAGAEDLAQP